MWERKRRKEKEEGAKCYSIVLSCSCKQECNYECIISLGYKEKKANLPPGINTNTLRE